MNKKIVKEIRPGDWFIYGDKPIIKSVNNGK